MSKLCRFCKNPVITYLWPEHKPEFAFHSCLNCGTNSASLPNVSLGELLESAPIETQENEVRQ